MGTRARPWWLAWMLPVLSGCFTSPSLPIAGDTRHYLPIETAQQRLPALVSWYENCSWRACDSNHERAQERLLECLNHGIRRSHSSLVAVAGGNLPPAQPSVLTEDPRERGQPDPRVTARVRESASRAGARFVLLIEAITLRVRSRDRERAFGPGDPYALMFGAWSAQTEWIARTTFNAVLADARDGRWVATIRRGREGEGGAESGFVAFLIPIIGVVQDPDTERLTCEAVGEAVGRLFGSKAPNLVNASRTGR